MVGSALAMASPSWHPGDCAYFQLSSGLYFEGVLVQAEGETWVIAVPAVEGLPGEAQSVSTPAGVSVPIVFLKLKAVCLRTACPPSWEEQVNSFGEKIPSLRSLMVEFREPSSVSEAEVAKTVARAKASAARDLMGTGVNAKRMARLAALYEAADADDEPASGTEDEAGEQAEEDFYEMRAPKGKSRKLKVSLSNPVATSTTPGRRITIEDEEPQRAKPRDDRRFEAIEEILMAGGDAEKLIQLEVVRLLREIRDERPAQGRRFDEWSLDDDEDRARTSLGKAFSRMETFRRRIRECPGRIAIEFREDVMRELGADESTPWKYRDYSKRIPWGMMKAKDELEKRSRATLKGNVSNDDKDKDKSETKGDKAGKGAKARGRGKTDKKAEEEG